jgi:transcriptional regulator with XRE-family HTH domain
MDVSELRQRLISSKGEWVRIRDEAKVSYSWLSKFANDRIPSPGIATLQKLETALDARRESASA